MTWTYAPSTDTWTKANAGREVITFETAIPNPGQVGLRSATTAHELAIAIRMDRDGRTCYEIAIDGADLVLRLRRFNKPQAALATAPHGITVGRPFTLKIRIDGTLMVGSVVREDGSTVEVQADVIDRASIIPWGVASDVDGATAQSITPAGTSAQVTTIQEVIYWLQGGNVYAIYTDLTVELVYAGLFGPDDVVQTDNVDGVAIFVGSGKSRKVNMVTRAGGAWTPTAGTLPGQTGPGTTTATLVAIHAGSPVLAGMPQQPLALYGPASGEIDNWDLTDLAEGHAWIRTSGDSSTVGDPITCITPGPNGSLFIGCTNSVNYMVGNPYEVTDQIVTRSYTYGTSGPNSAVMIGTPSGVDAIAMLSPHGLMLAPLGGAPVPISIDTLTSYVSFDAAERTSVRVTLAPDPERRMLHIFVVGPGRSVYVSYAEFVGGYAPLGRGYYPITLPVAPTCAKIWKGKVIMGTSDGRLVRFATAGDDLGSSINWEIPAHLLHGGPIESDTILHRVSLLMADTSVPAEVRIFAGQTPQAAYGASRQLVAGPRTIGPATWAWSLKARGPAMVMQFTGTGLVIFEAIDIVASTAKLTRRTVMQYAAVPPGPCKPASVPPAPPTPATPTETGDGDGGTLPDGNPDPDEEPATDAAVMPYPTTFGTGFSIPFSEAFYGMYLTDDGWGPGAWTGNQMNYWIADGDPAPGAPTSGFGMNANRFDRLPARFGGAIKYDTLEPGYSIPTSPGWGGDRIITENEFEPF